MANPSPPETRSSNGPDAWTLAVFGVGVLLLARVISWFMSMDDAFRPGFTDASVNYVFSGLGQIGACGGMLFAAMRGTGMSNGVRAALVLGAALILLVFTGVKIF